ncbi:MAG TPA: ABC transporter substrate-binding protein [Casimicrobiaceae bacterium]|nr:ABC transporter substrate-binding protein [Casimicrobiaceae bacterium]
MNRKSFLLVALASAALVALPLTAAKAQTRGGNVIVAITQAPPTLDAQITTIQSARYVSLHIFETLYARDENGKPIPDLAEGATVSPDGKTYTLSLRNGVKFHNGKTMTSADVVASLERYRKVGANASLLSEVESISAKGPNEVVIKLKKVQSTLIDSLSSSTAPLAIYPAEEAAKGPDKIAYIGTGPYKFVELSPDSHVKLERFKDYVPNPHYTKRDGFGGRKEAYFDTVTFRFMPEAGARVAALESGEVHVVETVDGPTKKRLERNTAYTIYPLLPFSFQIVKFNHAVPPTDNLAFRQAVVAALDMEEIMSIAYPDIYQLDGGWLYPNSPDYSNAGLKDYNKPDMKKAKELLAKSGYKGETLTFLVDNLRANTDTATVVQQRLAQIGVKVDIKVTDWPTAVKIGWSPAGWNLFAHGFGIQPFEGAGTVMASWTGGQLHQKPDPEIDRLYAEFSAEMNPEKRKALFATFQKHMIDNVIAAKVGNYGLFQVSTSKLHGFKPYRIPRMWGVWLDKS